MRERIPSLLESNFCFIDLTDFNGFDMNIPPSDFHTEAYKMVNTAITGAREYGLDISTLPPHLSVMTTSEVFIHECGSQATLLNFSLPEILQDIIPDFWSFIAHQKMSESSNSVGFIFWCLIEDRELEQSIFGLSFLKGQGFKGFLSDINFEHEPSLLTDPHEIVPSFLGYDFEEEYVVH